MELNIEPLIYETELLVKDILTTEATEAGSLGARRTQKGWEGCFWIR